MMFGKPKMDMSNSMTTDNMGLMNLLGDGNKSQLPSEINNPFSMENIIGISMYCDKKWFGEEGFDIWGTVKFKKGDTTGEQKIKANSLGELYVKVFNFCQELGIRRW